MHSQFPFCPSFVFFHHTSCLLAIEKKRVDFIHNVQTGERCSSAYTAFALFHLRPCYLAINCLCRLCQHIHSHSTLAIVWMSRGLSNAIHKIVNVCVCVNSIKVDSFSDSNFECVFFADNLGKQIYNEYGWKGDFLCIRWTHFNSFGCIGTKLLDSTHPTRNRFFGGWQASIYHSLRQ